MNKAQPAKRALPAEKAKPAPAPLHHPEEVKMVPIKDSSNIAVIGYHPQSQTLHVVFHNGGHYTYHHVDPKLHDQLMKAPSKGAFLHKHIKGRHRFTKLL
jgi:KTSC domain